MDDFVPGKGGIVCNGRGTGLLRASGTLVMRTLVI